jgi:hypothetical protein
VSSGASPIVGPRVAVIERRGKFLVAEPFFDRGPRLAVNQDRRANVGDLVRVATAAAAGGQRSQNGSGAPTSRGT